MDIPVRQARIDRQECERSRPWKRMQYIARRLNQGRTISEFTTSSPDLHVDLATLFRRRRTRQ